MSEKPKLDRSRFKPTKIADLKESDSELYAAAYDNGNKTRIPRKKINKTGTYMLRLYPGHPDFEGSLSIESYLVNYLPGMVPVYEDNKIQKDENGKVILKKGNKRIFNSKIHGGAKKDLVETYIKLVEADAKERFGADETKIKKFLEPINGNKYQKGAAIKYDGIKLQISYLCYADLVEGNKKTFYEIEFGKAIKNQINKIGAIESNDEPMATDGVFTDPEEGRLIKIVVNEDAVPQDYYTVIVDPSKEKIVLNGKTHMINKVSPLTDEDLEKLLLAPPLINYRSTFTNRDLQLQLEGLKMFEKEVADYNYIETEEFKEVFTYLDNLFPKENPQEVQAINSDDAEAVDQFELMSKDELKAWHKENKTGITILPSYTEDIIREITREYVNQVDSGNAEDVNEIEESTTIVEEVQVEQPKSGSNDLKARLDRLKQKTANKPTV